MKILKAASNLKGEKQGPGDAGPGGVGRCDQGD